MASHNPDFGRASALPFPAVLAAISSYPRPVIERLVGRLIETLDQQDGDADFEDATDAEDEDDDPAELDEPGCCGAYGIDQRIAAAPFNRAWHVDVGVHL